MDQEGVAYGAIGHEERGSSSSLVVRPSIIKGAGLGLFTSKRVEAGEVLCAYTGPTLPTREAIRLEDKSYLMRLGPHVYVDARESSDVHARYINDCRNPRGHNVTFDKRPEEGRALVVATRCIRPGEELWVDYGRWYWAGIHARGTRLSDEDLQGFWATLPPLD